MTAVDDTNRHGVLALAGLGVVLTLASWFSAAAVAPELAAEWSLAAGETAWLTAAVQLGFVVGALTASALALADLWPPARVMAASAAVASIANAALLIEPGVEGAIASRFLVGVALAGVYPPSLKFIAGWFRTGRGLAMGAMVGALTLGSATPHLARALGADVDWRFVVAATSVAGLMGAAIFAVGLRDGPHRLPTAPIDPRRLGAILRNRAAMLANLGYFGHMWELYAMWGWFLAFAGASLAATGDWPIGASLLTFAVIAMGAPGCVVAGLAADRYGRCATTAVAMAVSGACALLVGLAFDGPFWLLAIVALAWGFAVVADSAQFSAAVTELSAPDQVGAALAFQMGVGFAITIVAIQLTPVLADALGSWRWTFVMLAPGPAIGVVAMLTLRRLPEAERLAGGRR